MLFFPNDVRSFVFFDFSIIISSQPTLLTMGCPLLWPGRVVSLSQPPRLPVVQADRPQAKMYLVVVSTDLSTASGLFSTYVLLAKLGSLGWDGGQTYMEFGLRIIIIDLLFVESF